MQSVVGCLQQAPVRQIRSQGDGGLHALFVGTGEPVLLRGPAGVYVGVRLRYRVVRSDASEGPWEVRIVAYQYALLDREQREILAFHLHPDGASQVTAPHVHLGSGAGTLRADLVAAHIPRGIVSLAAVVGLAIDGFKARSLRADWRPTLARADRELLDGHAR